jgi:hypothetical protein
MYVELAWIRALMFDVRCSTLQKSAVSSDPLQYRAGHPRCHLFAIGVLFHGRLSFQLDATAQTVSMRNDFSANALTMVYCNLDN